MRNKLITSKKIGTTVLALSLVGLLVKNVYADAIVSTTKSGLSTFEIGCTVTVQKPACNTNVKFNLPAANEYGKLYLMPNQSADITVINSHPKNSKFKVDIEVKAITAGNQLATTIATAKSFGSSDKPFIVTNHSKKPVTAFILVNNLAVNTTVPSLLKDVKIKVIAKNSLQEVYITSRQWIEVSQEAREVLKKEGIPFSLEQPFGCTVNTINEQCNSLLEFPLQRGESVNVAAYFGPDLPKNARVDWQLTGYEEDGSEAYFPTALSTVQTSYKNETKTFRNDTGRAMIVGSNIINFTYDNKGSNPLSKKQVTVFFSPVIKK